MPAIDPVKRGIARLENSAALFSPATFVDTNKVLRKAIQTLSPDLRNEVVLRCDDMAHLQGVEENIEQAFTQLLQLIAAEKATDKKLFLHITCFHDDKAPEETIDNGLQRYIVQFHTNISLSVTWLQEAESRINGIASLLLPFGKLQVNQLKNSGCVFSISLPGK